MVVIVWQLDLQLPMHSVPITTNDVNLNPAHGDTTLCDKVCQVGVFLQFPPPIKLTTTT